MHQSNLLDLVTQPRKSVCIFPDGNVAWNSAATAKHMRVEPVSHQLRVFCRPTHKGTKTISGQAGTQCIDRSWGALKPWLPRRLILKIKENGQSTFNVEVAKYCYMWMWRQHIMHDEPLKPLAFLKKLSEIM